MSVYPRTFVADPGAFSPWLQRLVSYEVDRATLVALLCGYARAVLPYIEPNERRPRAILEVALAWASCDPSPKGNRSRRAEESRLRLLLRSLRERPPYARSERWRSTESAGSAVMRAALSVESPEQGAMVPSFVLTVLPRSESRKATEKMAERLFEARWIVPFGLPKGCSEVMQVAFDWLLERTDTRRDLSALEIDASLQLRKALPSLIPASSQAKGDVLQAFYAFAERLALAPEADRELLAEGVSEILTPRGGGDVSAVQISSSR